MTKLIALLAAGLLSAAAPALASTATDIPGPRFSFTQDQRGNGIVRFGNVNADPGSVIEVYDYSLGQQGYLIATKALRPGHNTNVRVAVGAGRAHDVVAVLKVDGVEVGRQVMDANDR